MSIILGAVAGFIIGCFIYDSHSIVKSLRTIAQCQMRRRS